MAKLHASPFSARNSPRGRRSDDSPSRQLQWELDRALGQLQLHEIESSKLHAYQKRQQQDELDAREAAQAHVHQLELNAANAQHEVVRKQAEAVLQAYIKREEEERRKREEDERKRLEEEERRRKAEEEARRKAEEERRVRKEEEARREREELARQEAERRAKEKADAEEKERREREAEQRGQQEENAKAEKEAALRKLQDEAAAKAALTPRPATESTTSRPTQAPSSGIEQQHHEYRALHKKLKIFRSEFWTSTRKDAALKPHVGDMRRAIRTSVGQLTDDKAANKVAHDRVKTTLLRALKELPSPPASVSDFLPAHLNLGDRGTTTVPSLVLYLLSIFSKAVIAAFVGECAVNPKAAEPIGTLVAQIFSMPDLQFARNAPANDSSRTLPNQSLIPILMCKFHAAAPILFGISGSESTTAGKLRLGWRLDRIDDSADSKRAFTTQNKHYDRLTGLGVGYASIALRNFSKARFQNPWPPVHFWSSLAHIINTPPREVQTSHLILLKNMLENNSIDRFVLFFGAVGVAALRQAVVEFPKSLPHELQEKQVTKSLHLMVEGWKKENHFSLT
ncbi:RNA export mediator Gle1 [Cladophialophora carrionii]|uniref:mRNA export factor GLE1 n=1 Tax=Cladophialophora carrionii TaxID=86049 RepID=A0A1C1CT32_9EURO|nr:RNA export mediator Gle1 [Cladophialophora carrionii]